MGTRAWRKQQEALRRERLAAQKKAAPPPKEEKLPDGLFEMLQTKGELQEYLQQFQKHPVVVSVELMNDEKWVYVVRGIRPPIAHWNEHEIWFVKSGSSNVWSPTLQIRGGF